MPNAGLSRECEELSQHKLLAAKGFFSALPRFLLFPGNRGAQMLTSSALGSLPAGSSENVVLRSRFSVMGSEAGYTETVDGDYSDFDLAYGVYRQ